MCAYNDKFRPQTISKLAESVRVPPSLSYLPFPLLIPFISRSLELFYTRLRGRSIATTLSRRGGREAPRKSRRLKSTRHFHIDSVVCVGSTRSQRRDPFSARKSHRVPSPSIPRSFDRENASPELRVKTRRKFPSPPKSSPRRDKKKNVYVAIAFASRAESTSRDLSETRERNCWDGFLQSFARKTIYSSLPEKEVLVFFLSNLSESSVSFA